MSFQSFSRDALNTNRWLLFVLLCTFTFFLLLIKKSFLESGTAAFEVLELQGEAGMLKMLSALQYATIPVIYLWKFMIIALLLWVGCFLFGYNISYGKCFQIALVGEFIFLAPEIYKILHFIFLPEDVTLYEINIYYPFSLIQLVDVRAIDQMWVYPLKALNIFEIIYWFILYYLLHQSIGKQKWAPVTIVSIFYILPFFIWLAYYMGIYK